MSFKYCDPCAIELKLSELAIRPKDTCDNCGALNVEVSLGDKKPSEKRKPASKKKATKAKGKSSAKKTNKKSASK